MNEKPKTLSIYIQVVSFSWCVLFKCYGSLAFAYDQCWKCVHMHIQVQRVGDTGREREI